MILLTNWTIWTCRGHRKKTSPFEPTLTIHAFGCKRFLLVIVLVIDVATRSTIKAAMIEQVPQRMQAVKAISAWKARER